MKAKLEFNLPEEKEEYKIYSKAMDYHILVEDFSNYMRRKYKHKDPESAAREKEYKEIANDWFNLIRENLGED